MDGDAASTCPTPPLLSSVERGSEPDISRSSYLWLLIGQPLMYLQRKSGSPDSGNTTLSLLSASDIIEVSLLSRLQPNAPKIFRAASLPGQHSAAAGLHGRTGFTLASRYPTSVLKNMALQPRQEPPGPRCLRSPQGGAAPQVTAASHAGGQGRPLARQAGTAQRAPSPHAREVIPPPLPTAPAASTRRGGLRQGRFPSQPAPRKEKHLTGYQEG